MATPAVAAEASAPPPPDQGAPRSEPAGAARVAVRNVRRDGFEAARKLEKDSEISEDERHDLETDIQKLTDDHVKQIDDALSNKETEITKV